LRDDLQFIERHPLLIARILIAFYTKLNTNTEKLSCMKSQQQKKKREKLIMVSD